MKDKAQFQKKLNELLMTAKENDGTIAKDSVRDWFEGDVLTEEQLNLVYDYLLAQKVVVKGYFKQPEKEADVLTEEERQYLKEYEKELDAIPHETEGERKALIGQVLGGDLLAKQRLTLLYLKEVITIAKEMHRADTFLGDLIQEGNLGVILGVELIEDVESADETIVTQIRQHIQSLIEEQAEAKNSDAKMVEKVSALDEAIVSLTEELGRKVSVDELAVYLGMTEDEINDILRVAGENPEEEDTEE